MQKIKVLVISGPTGVGKTLLGALCAKQLDGELISCDSVQVIMTIRMNCLWLDAQKIYHHNLHCELS